MVARGDSLGLLVCPCLKRQDGILSLLLQIMVLPTLHASGGISSEVVSDFIDVFLWAEGPPALKSRSTQSCEENRIL